MIPKSRVLSPYNNKNDVVRPAHNTNNNPVTPIASTSTEPNTFILFCPTARTRPTYDSALGSRESRHGRFNDKIYLSGYKERINISAFVSFLWRRIVFWAYVQIPAAMGPRKGGSDASASTYYTRQMTPISNQLDLRTLVFEGNQGVDYDVDTLIQAPVNKRFVHVQMDKTYNLNPNTTNPKIFNFNHYYRGGPLWYQDNESGNYNTGSPWSCPNRSSKGNMYILDIFSPGVQADQGRDMGLVQCEGRLYWSES